MTLRIPPANVVSCSVYVRSRAATNRSATTTVVAHVAFTRRPCALFTLFTRSCMFVCVSTHNTPNARGYHSGCCSHLQSMLHLYYILHMPFIRYSVLHSQPYYYICYYSTLSKKHRRLPAEPSRTLAYFHWQPSRDANSRRQNSTHTQTHTHTHAFGHAFSSRQT